MVRVKNLFKKYDTERGDVNAVAGINFNVKEGEFFTLLGPSGCGKSTTLRCIAGLERPDSGEITIGEKVVYSSEKHLFDPPNQRDIAMVFQSYAIWPHMNVYSNVAYPLEGKIPKEAIRDRVMEVLKMVGIDDLATRPAPQLSGGQQQRVAVARAIVKGAKVLLFDEPLSNLDVKMRVHMRSELRSLQKRLDTTFVYVTHDQEEAFSLSDRVALMHEGKLVELATPANIYLKPSNYFTADFVGACNFLPGKILNKNRELFSVETKIGEISCSITDQDTEDIVISIRPEHVEIIDQDRDTDNMRNIVQGIVDSTTFLGSTLDCVVKVGSERLRVMILSSRFVSEGEKVILHLPPQFCNLLPTE